MKSLAYLSEHQFQENLTVTGSVLAESRMQSNLLWAAALMLIHINLVQEHIARKMILLVQLSIFHLEQRQKYLVSFFWPKKISLS